jgi:pimeloyl-ACP methyl ester carboxylesterase
MAQSFTYQFISLLFPLLVLRGCATDSPRNSSFALSILDAEHAWDSMKNTPAALPRPLVVLGGIFDPGAGARDLADQFRAIATDDSQVLSVTFAGAYTFDECAARVIDSVDRAWTSPDPQHTVEVDVVACSMGGLVARQAACDPPDGPSRKRLRIARLFTISTPHCGAASSFNHPLDRRIADMRPDSPFIKRLNSTQRDYELYCYVLLNDGVVGEVNAAPPGCDPWWLPNAPFTSSHMLANDDVRILADIARRLRGEEPFSTPPPAPLPPRHRLLKSRI